MFLIDIRFKGCQNRSNRASIGHAVSYFACGVSDPAYTVHAVSLTPHARVHAESLTPLAFFLHSIAVLHMIFTF
jgi:hypothetical protein